MLYSWQAAAILLLIVLCLVVYGLWPNLKQCTTSSRTPGELRENGLLEKGKLSEHTRNASTGCVRGLPSENLMPTARQTFPLVKKTTEPHVQKKNDIYVVHKTLKTGDTNQKGNETERGAQANSKSGYSPIEAALYYTELISYQDMKTVSTMTGINFHKLTWELFSHVHIDTLLTENVITQCEKSPDPYTQCFTMLTEWKKQCPNPTRELLIQSLKSIGLNAIVRAIDQEKVSGEDQERSPIQGRLKATEYNVGEENEEHTDNLQPELASADNDPDHADQTSLTLPHSQTGPRVPVRQNKSPIKGIKSIFRSITPSKLFKKLTGKSGSYSLQ